MKGAVIGLQYGDEGKAAIEKTIILYDLYLPKGERYVVVFRYNGGCNSGQTTVGKDGKELRSHIVPVGIEFDGIYSCFLSGGVIYPKKVMKEILSKQDRGYTIEPENFGISKNAQVTLWYHLKQEREIERKRGKRRFNTTMNAIAPTYAGTALKQNIRMEEFCNPESFIKFLGEKVEEGLIYPKHVDHYIKSYAEAQEFLRPYLVSQDVILRRYKDSHSILGAAQSVGLDVLDGTTPYTSSSSLIRLPIDVQKRIGVLKMVPSRVGNGPFVTEIGFDTALANAMRGRKEEIDGEYGKSSGRPRRIGHYDKKFARYAFDVANIDSLALTKFDQLAKMAQNNNGKLLVCAGYRYKGEKLDEFPADRYVLAQCEPVYEEVRGWKDFNRVRNAREFRDLPKEAQEFVKRHVCGPLDADLDIVDIISVGPSAEQKIIMTA